MNHHVALRPRYFDAGFGQSVADLHRQLGARLDPIAEVPGQMGPSLHDQPLGGGFSLDEYLGEIQRRFLSRAMDEAGGVKKKAAELLGFDNYQTLSNRLEKLGNKD